MTCILDINLRDQSGYTALHEAVEADNQVSVNFLLKHGADPTVQNDRQMAPIHLAADADKAIALEVHCFLLFYLSVNFARSILQYIYVVTLHSFVL